MHHAAPPLSGSPCSHLGSTFLEALVAQFSFVARTRSTWSPLLIRYPRFTQGFWICTLRLCHARPWLNLPRGACRAILVCCTDAVDLDPFAPYVRFDLNDYSIPHTHVRRVLTLTADLDEVRILDGQHILACHLRSFDKGAQIEDGAHVAALVAQKHAARRHRATDHLAAAVPAVEGLLVRAAERGGNLGSITSTLMQLLARYGAAELQAAVLEALERNVPHPNAVCLVLERRREERQEPPPIAVTLPEHVRAKDQPVRPHDLAAYDKLKETADED